MKFNFLGRGAAFYPAYDNTCAYFRSGSELYLLDCGETAFSQLYRKGKIDGITEVYVILTHLHADHVGSLGSLISYCYYICGVRIYVIHPEETVVELLTLEGIDRKNYHYRKEIPKNGAGLGVEFVPVKHAPDMKCYGLLLSDQTETVYYSGDAAEVPERIRDAYLSGSVSRIYQDTSTHDAEKPSHCFYGKLEKCFPPEKRANIFCMHLDSPCEELLEKKGFSVVKDENLC